jgi:antitoxin (DNA-binding transcriptional repressor) of toxin-antitoxin stability system
MGVVMADPLSRLAAGDVHTYTVTQLNQQTPQVLDEINSSGMPALVTKRGKFVALLVPLEGVPVERMLLQALTRGDLGSPAEGVDSESELLNPAEVASRLGL